MWLVVGLGNPGSEYAHTRHNVGFLVVDSLNSQFSLPSWTKKKYYLMSKGIIMGHKVALMKPLTYMNRSGLAVQSFLSYYKEKKQLMVIHDDLDLAVGTLRIRCGGSSGGHKGVKSIAESLDFTDLIRVKIGIGRPLYIPVSDYVLNPFGEKEKEPIQHCLKRAQEAVVVIIDKGLACAQNIFNKKEVLCNEESTNDPSWI